MKKLLFLLSSVFAFAFFQGCDLSSQSGKICNGDPITEEAYYKSVRQGDDTAIITNGRKITPYYSGGGLVYKGVGVFPIGADISSNGEIMAISNNGITDVYFKRDVIAGVDADDMEKYYDEDYQSVTIIDMNKKEAIYKIPLKSLFVGIGFSPDSKRLYAAGGGGDVIRVIDILSYPSSATGFSVAVSDSIPIPYYPTGLAISKDSKKLFVTQLQHHNLSIVDVDKNSNTYGKIITTFVTESYPYGVLLSEDETEAYVSNWGGNSVTVIDLKNSKVIKSIEVGKNPEGLAIYDNKLFVSNSGDDNLSVIDLDTYDVSLISLKDSDSSPIGITPTDIKIDKDNKLLYVVCAGDNKLDVIDLTTLKITGSIPAGFYPTEVEVDNKLNLIAVVNSKGKLRKDSFANPDDEHIANIGQGLINIFTPPSTDELETLTKKTKLNNSTTKRFYSSEGCSVWNNPIPKQLGDVSPIKHVVYIVRENKTYDVDLGDLETGNGAPELALFGEDVTPNLHALARQFTNFDNYYSEPEQSVQGHIWIGGGWSTDFDEKIWLAMWGRPDEHQVFLPVMQQASKPNNGSLFEYFYNQGLDFRIYGEYTGTLDNYSKIYYDKLDWKYPAWSLHVNDTDKAKEFIREMNSGIFPSFIYLWVPNDHTYGATPGRPDPTWMVGNNDEGTGMIIDAISKSRYWGSTVIFVFEDDPQSTPDHIDAHRSILVAAGPYVKRNYTSHVHYSIPSIHHTTELILGIPPMSRYDELAAPLYDAFTANYNPAGYNHIKSSIPFSVVPEGANGSVESLNMNFDEPDQSPGLGKVLWKYIKGDEPFPSHIAYMDDDDDDD